MLRLRRCGGTATHFSDFVATPMSVERTTMDGSIYAAVTTVAKPRHSLSSLISSFMAKIRTIPPSPSPVIKPLPAFRRFPRLTSKLEIEDKGTSNNVRPSRIRSVYCVTLTTSPMIRLFESEGALKRTLALCVLNRCMAFASIFFQLSFHVPNLWHPVERVYPAHPQSFHPDRFLFTSSTQTHYFWDRENTERR